MAPKMLMGIFPSVIFLLLLGGCSIGPDYEKPQITTDADWQENGHISLTTKPLKDIAWWSYFHDPILDHLINEAVKNNLDIESALAKIRQIRTNVSKSIANLFPTITGNGAIQENKESINTASSSELGTYRVFEAGYNTSWEIDLFGRMGRATESENALFESSIEDGRSVILTLLSDIATNYIKLRNYQQQFIITQELAAAWNGYIYLQMQNKKTCHETDIDWLNIQVSYNQAMAQIPIIKSNIQVTINQICFLLGKPPGFLNTLLQPPASIPQADPVIFANLPGEILLNRPDIKKAERQLASETANIGAAKGNLFPKFALTGGYNWESQKSSNLFTNKSIAWSIGPSVSLPIFDFGKICADIDAQYAARDQAFIAFKKILLTALHDVENSLSIFGGIEQNMNFLKTSMNNNELAYKLGIDRNKSGLCDDLSIAPLKILYLTSRQDYSNAVCAFSTNMVNLYKALGGGWNVLSVHDKNLNIEQINLKS